MEIGPITRALMRNKTRFILIVVQIAVTLAVVTNAVNMIVAERQRMTKSSGFDDENLLWVYSKPYASNFDDRTFRINVTQADTRALASMPGVRAAMNTNFLPWQGGGSSGEVNILGQSTTRQRTQIYTASPSFVDTLGVKIVSGRNLRDSDVDLDPNLKHSPVIISRALEKLLFKGESAIGRQIGEADTYDTIVGVFDPFYNPYGWPIHEYCVVYPGVASRGGSRYLVRVQPGKMKEVAQQVEKRLMAVNGDRNFELKTVSEIKNRHFTDARIIIGAMTAVILLIILVTGLGIVGVTSFTVAERRKQIGTRRALGASKAAILRYFLVENWIVTNTGLVLGVLLAFALNYALVTNTSASKLDWRYVAAGVIMLWIQGAIATLAPAMRAAAVPPVIATRAV